MAFFSKKNWKLHGDYESMKNFFEWIPRERCIYNHSLDWAYKINLPYMSALELVAPFGVPKPHG